MKQIGMSSLGYLVGRFMALCEFALTQNNIPFDGNGFAQTFLANPLGTFTQALSFLQRLPNASEAINFRLQDIGLSEVVFLGEPALDRNEVESGYMDESQSIRLNCHVAALISSHNLSQLEAATLSGVNRQTIQRYVRHMRNADPKVVARLERSLNEAQKSKE